MAAQRADSLAEIAAESTQQAGQSQHSLREQPALEGGEEDAADRGAHTDQAAPAADNHHASDLTRLQQPATEAAPQERARATPAHQPAPAAVSQGATDHSPPPSLPDPAESALQGSTAGASQLLTMRGSTALQNRPAGTSVQLERSDLQTTPGKSNGPALAQQCASDGRSDALLSMISNVGSLCLHWTLNRSRTCRRGRCSGRVQTQAGGCKQGHRGEAAAGLEATGAALPQVGQASCCPVTLRVAQPRQSAAKLRAWLTPVYTAPVLSQDSGSQRSGTAV